MAEWFWWCIFGAIIIVSLALDLFVFHREKHEVKVKEALIWSAVWIFLALLFNAGIYFFKGAQEGEDFLAGYLLEKSLSVDNIFVFVMIFAYLGIPLKYQHHILFWGIMGAIIMRFLFIFSGATLLRAFHWMIYVFGGFLILTGLKMMFLKREEVHPEKNIMLRTVKKIIPLSLDFHEGKFFTKINKKIFATPIFVALVLIESSDIMFAIDSVPLILAITQDIFIVFTSNIFAILGLRALYFAFAGLVNIFKHLKYGVSFLLIFVGCKMCVSKYFPIPTKIVLLVIVITILISILTSIYSDKKQRINAREEKQEI